MWNLRQVTCGTNKHTYKHNISGGSWLSLATVLLCHGSHVVWSCMVHARHHLNPLIQLATHDGSIDGAAFSMLCHGSHQQFYPLWMLAFIYQHQPDPSWVLTLIVTQKTNVSRSFRWSLKTHACGERVGLAGDKVHIGVCTPDICNDQRWRCCHNGYFDGLVWLCASEVYDA